MLKGKKVFVSGGNGVIGNELVSRLHAEGAVILVGDLKPRPLDWPEDILYRQGDLNYISKSELEAFSPEIFFHLAATFERSAESYEFWEENFNHNVNLSHHLMTVLKDSRSLKKVIFASSYLIYSKELYNFDQPMERPYSLSEIDPISPRNLTGCAKLSHEIELNFLKGFKGDDLQIVNARIYRSYGKNSRDIISRWVRALLKNEIITVFNKENIFDYTYAGDVAEGLLRLSKTSYNGVVNLGTGNSRRISEVVEVLRSHFPNMKLKEVGQKILYESSQANTDLLKKLTEWTPQNRIEDIIPKIIKFEREVGYSENSCEVNVLITSISKKVGLIKSVREAMNKIGSTGRLFGGDVNQNCIGRYFVDNFWLMPKTNDENLEKIAKYCLENKISVIIPSRDGELDFWSRNKNNLYDQGITVMVSDEKAVENCVDKYKFYQECKKHNLSAIETSKKAEEIKGARYVVKEKFGAGSRTLGLDLNIDDANKHAKELSDPIFQPYIKGAEFSADLYVSKSGNVMGVVVRERNLVVDGESQITTTVSNTDIEEMCVKFAKAFKLFGHNILQVLVDDNNKIHIIECNSRFGGASTLAITTGLDSFYWLLLESLGNNIDSYKFNRVHDQLRQIRYPSDKIVTI